MNGKDGADGDVDADVGRTVERIVHQHVLATTPVLANRYGNWVLVFLRGDDAHAARVLDAVPHSLVGEHVELLLYLALDVDRAEFAEDIGEPGAPHLARDDLGGEAQIIQQVRQLPRGFGVQPLLLHDEPLNRDDRRR